jgi:hypothetical protein
LESSENENIINQNLWDTAKAVLRGNFIAMSTYIKNVERSKINNLILHFKLLEKQEKLNSKLGDEIIKIRVKINEIDNKKNYAKNQ